MSKKPSKPNQGRECSSGIEGTFGIVYGLLIESRLYFSKFLTNYLKED